jgi:transcriptional regulator with XRE-family HTH domain
VTRSRFLPRFQRAKKASGLTMDELAKKAGFASKQALDDWTRQKQRDADVERIEKVAKALGVEPAWLAGLK